MDNLTLIVFIDGKEIKSGCTLQTNIEQVLETKSKKEQAWEIAVKKRIDLWNLKVCSTAEHYNKLLPKYEEFKNCKLTKEEFELLKSQLEE